MLAAVIFSVLLVMGIAMHWGLPWPLALLVAWSVVGIVWLGLELLRAQPDPYDDQLDYSDLDRPDPESRDFRYL